MQETKKIIARLSQYLLALLFIFSGFVKSIDPTGSALKFTEYFHAFGTDFMEPLSFSLAITLSGAELLLGLCLMLNLRARLVSLLILLFMGFFTALTLVSAVTDRVTDCGCFGDAIKLSNWGTFYKNLVFLVLALINFRYWKDRPPTGEKGGRQMTLIGGLAVFSFGLGIASLASLPMFDFLPYQNGVNIPRAMSVPADAPQDVVETQLVYRNRTTGQLQHFTLEDTEWQDETTWDFVDVKTRVLQKGFRPPIEQFSIFDESGDVTAGVLSDTTFTFVLAIDDVDRLSAQRIERAGQLLAYTLRKDYNLICVTSEPLVKTRSFFRQHFGYEIPCYNMDHTTLKSFMRASSGVVVLRDGTILSKWNLSRTPSLQDDDLSELAAKIRNRMLRARIFTLFFLALLFYFGYRIQHKQNSPNTNGYELP